MPIGYAEVRVNITSFSSTVFDTDDSEGPHTPIRRQRRHATVAHGRHRSRVVAGHTRGLRRLRRYLAAAFICHVEVIEHK